ncbi:methionyl-tRNA formyltransferase [Neisseriaceae bacterium PsAf]|nr:methionyl-tRNA formyltransferase [Neisseriaceae bacterium PsAf]MCV2503329.1 methionyl-tRNA formyltransferase [Neisseriaceae bacterium]
MKVIFAGTPEFASHTLQKLIDSHIEVVAVLTQPDRPKGRGMKLTESPVKEVAKKNNIQVLQPNTLKDEEIIEQLKAYQADLMIVVAYGLIIPSVVLNLPRYGCINIHASILPRWRGAAPIHRAIEAGDKKTGISIMQMDAGLDTGPVLKMQEVMIEERETTASLHDKLKEVGADLCVQVLKELPELIPVSQSQEGVTYAHKIQKKEAIIDWHESAVVIDRKIRAFNPFPIAKTKVNEQEIKIWQAKVLSQKAEQLPGSVVSVTNQGIEVATSEGWLLIEQIQKSGSQKMAVKDFILGFPIKVGTVFG